MLSAPTRQGAPHLKVEIGADGVVLPVADSEIELAENGPRLVAAHFDGALAVHLVVIIAHDADFVVLAHRKQGVPRGGQDELAVSAMTMAP